MCSVDRKPRVVAEDQACWPVVGNPGLVDGSHCSCPRKTDLGGHLSSTLCGRSQGRTWQTARKGQLPVVSDKTKLQRAALLFVLQAHAGLLMALDDLAMQIAMGWMSVEGGRVYGTKMAGLLPALSRSLTRKWVNCTNSFEPWPVSWHVKRGTQLGGGSPAHSPNPWGLMRA